MTRRQKSGLKRLSEQLTGGKLSLGGGRRRRRSARLKVYEQALGFKPAPALSREAARLMPWLRHRVAGAAMLLIAGLVGYLLFGASWFYIYDIEVEGARLATKEELYNRSNLEALHLFWLNPPAVARRLEEDPLIARALVSLRPSGRVRVQVQERLPVAVWQTAGQSFLVDGEGVLFGLRGDASELLVIRDLRDQPLEVGSTVDPAALRAARELAQLLPERRAFEWEPGHGLSFVSEEEWRVVFGDHTRLPTKVRAYRAFQEQIAPPEEILLLDLSVPEHPYYRVGEPTADGS